MDSPAHDTLVASLEPRRQKPLTKAVRFVANLIDAALSGVPDAVGDADLVVRRRSTGEIVLQTPADVGAPQNLLDGANKDLATMTEREFLEAWSARLLRRLPRASR
ncbi:MAG TPA: hypothetical protein VGP24_12335 [Glaciihabitans sp.]|jgi:hypothetical protein|nr:hypothetical protein [Glaciihabitans sp.]